MNVLKEGKTLAVNVVKDVIGHWKTPGGKNQVSYKEILNLGLGGMGQQLVIMLTGYFSLSVGNTLIGSTIGITPMHIQYMSMIQTVLNVSFAIIRSKIVDNTRTRWGAFSPVHCRDGDPDHHYGGCVYLSARPNHAIYAKTVPDIFCDRCHCHGAAAVYRYIQ